MKSDIFNVVSNVKKKVLLRAPVLTQSGYGVHSRQVAKWLFGRKDIDLHFQALPWGDTPWLIDKDMDSGFIGSIMQRTVDPTGNKYDIAVQLQLPNEWDPKLGRVNIGITAGVETDVCNPAWIKACNAMSAIVVPSEHTKKCLTSTGHITTPIHVIPEAYSDALTQAVSDSKVSFSTDFNFLMVGQLTGNNPENDRKNIFYTIKWFCEVFSGQQDVGLVVKTNAGRNTAIDRVNVIKLMQTLLSEVRKDSPFPRVHLIHGEMSDSEIASLYSHPQIKAFVSLTRGEGYGLPLLEAATAGLPVIATGWSGHTDFLPQGKYLNVDYKLTPIHDSRVDNNIFVKGAKWAMPSEQDFKKKIEEFRKDPSQAQTTANNLRQDLLMSHSLAKVNSTYDSKLNRLMS